VNPFSFERSSDVGHALAAIGGNPAASFIAGGTEMLNWMKEGIARPTHLVDINRLPLASIELGDSVLTLGALARMSDVAAHDGVRKEFPAIAESLELSASPQLRNMASMGGNLMQRTRCPYFRAEVELPCNKRKSGSGCSARHGENRGHAIFGWNENCVATHASDVAVVLMMLDAVVQLRGTSGDRSVSLAEFYLPPRAVAEPDLAIRADELIVAIQIPRSSAARRSRYLKIRERASYEFALVSAAAAIELDGKRILSARLALGGVAHKPWRLQITEQALVGQEFSRETVMKALEQDFAAARSLEHNAFKIPLAKRAAARALEAAAEVTL
jgi:xanthine dehydrogenase YagS FAD-binding subunit